jgi:lipid II:glycine glycyltransferase (peptidoglycan interpeptide bridge formation enzyme)
MRAPLLQCWGYGEVQAAEGWTPERIELGSVVATVLLAGRGIARWAYVPRGPVPADAGAIDALVDWARGRRLARLRLEPEAPSRVAEQLRERGFRPAPALQPQHTLIVPLAGEEEMLAAFKPKHRYNVRLALKRGIEVAVEDDPRELDRQHAQTAVRQGIAAASLRAYERRLRELPDCHIYVARHEGRALAAIMVARFHGRAYYLFGGSTGEKRELMPTYAVQWAAMLDAAAGGCAEYDLWGVPPSEDPAHPWHGLWQFKTGFGGSLVAYAGAWDLVLNPAAVGLLEARDRLRRGIRTVGRWRNIR